MPISATGADHEKGFTPARRYAENGFTPHRRSAENGFTLVELMIVLVIIGLMSAAVVVLMPDPRGKLVHEAERFAARAQIVRDGAVIDGREASVVVDPLGYGFEEKRQGAWHPIQQKALGRTRWSEGTGIAMGRETHKTVIFDTTGLVSEPVTLTLKRGGERVGIAIGLDGDIRVVL
ncbi:GspH/FimT family pseudopilin [Sphingobium boeckii]|uniref:Type II secretion system protein H n=1 Tax=Sphingobium boeckii TaxID=1082345 RepID=A0A7W9AKY2_9SPHN|nr:GspH/FimT family pseudopilin [Sphingobium boeckii]MBB5687433.1 general secretion pathway protein H [Sphingobium boeckii]